MADAMERARKAKDIREAALGLRSRLGLADQVAPDMLDVLRKLPAIKVAVEIIPDASAPLVPAWTAEQRLFLKESVFNRLANGDVRARWTIAHELAHLALGHEGRNFRLAPGAPRLRPSNNANEREANTFAATFLFPGRLAKGKTVDEIAKQFSIGQFDASTGVRELVLADEAPLAPAVRARPDIIGELIRHGYSEDELAQLVVPKRTLARRRAGNELLTVEETDKALRLKRIAALAEQTFGDLTKANRWLRKPKRSLGGETPLAFLASENGARVVEEMLGRIEHGIYA